MAVALFSTKNTFSFTAASIYYRGKHWDFVSYNSPTASLARNALLPLFMDYYFPANTMRPPFPANAVNGPGYQGGPSQPD